MIVPTTFMAEQDWFDSTLAILIQYTLPRYEGDWVACAEAWIKVPSLASLNIPSPFAFNDWREWAYRFNNVVF